jgi:CheY-like chemotaxis protein
VRMDLLSAREVQEVLATQAEENAGAPLGHTAVRLGLIDDDELSRALERQITEVVAELLGWRDGAFALSERDVMRTYVPAGYHVDAMRVLLEAAGAQQEEEAGAVVGSTVFARAGDPTSVALPDGAWEVLRHVDGKRSARTVAAEVDLPMYRVSTVLGSLEALGVVARVAFALEEPLVALASPSHALQRLLRLAVERVGARATLTMDGPSTLSVLAGERPQAVVVDADLEGDAWATVRALRQVDGLAHVPILVLGAAEPRGFGLGRWTRPRADTMTKPFDELELQQWLARRLGRPLV